MANLKKWSSSVLDMHYCANKHIDKKQMHPINPTHLPNYNIIFFYKRNPAHIYDQNHNCKNQNGEEPLLKIYMKSIGLWKDSCVVLKIFFMKDVFFYLFKFTFSFIFSN